ncbi:MAG: cytidine deaminase [Bacteroidales bacterium]|nr:cytidine deaminase [Bacteroidales bacterium]
MRKKEHHSIFYECSSLSELSPSDRQLVEKAETAASNAYAPYSEFHVGSAVLLENGRSFVGNNQENVAFPSGLCAERVAVFYAKAQFPEVPIETLAIAALKKGKLAEEPPAPCGGCLQVLLENERRDQHPIKIVLYGSNKIVMGEGVRQFMPLGFDGKAL